MNTEPNRTHYTFEPAPCNPCHPRYNRWDNWTKDFAEKMVLLWMSQGGTEYRGLKPAHAPYFLYLLEQMGDEISALCQKAWNTIGETPRDNKKHETF